MSSRVVILGAGTAGTLAANRLRRLAAVGTEIVVVDQDDQHIYQPGLLFVPFGSADPADLIRPRRKQLAKGVAYIQSAIDHVAIEENMVHLEDGSALHYDVLIIATGARLVPEETEGLTGPLWNNKVFTFYDMDSASTLREALSRFSGGRLVVNVVDMPIKCPVAPLEFCFLADAYFTHRGIRDRVEITYATPLDGAFTKPVASAALAQLLADKNIKLVTEFNTGEVCEPSGDEQGHLAGFDGREVPFELAVVIPMHSGAAYVGRSEGLGDDLDFIPTDPATLQTQVRPNIFAIGDATNIPASKAGSVAHFEGDALVENVAAFLKCEDLPARFDGHANCFIETGFHQALLIDFNYKTEPLPGHFPLKVGMPLLRQSRMNHIGKLMFQWFYWHILLPGHDVPGIGSAMPEAGKRRPARPPATDKGE